MIEISDVKDFTLVTEKTEGSLSFALGIFFNIGTRDENNFPNGVAHYFEHCIFKGSKRKTAKEIVIEFERIGAYINAFTTKEGICFYVRALNKHFAKCSELLFELVFEPAFPLNEIKKETNIILDEINIYEDDYEEMIFDYADDILFSSNSLANPILGTSKSVKKLNKVLLTDFSEFVLNQKDIIISYVGIESLPIIEKVLTSLLPNKLNLQNSRNNEFIYIPKIKSFKKDSHQSHLLICRAFKKPNFGKRIKLSIINSLLGEGMSSKLYQSLRENSGIAYSVYSTQNFYSDITGFYIYVGTDRKKIEKSISLIKNCFKSLSEGKLSDLEFEISKEQLSTSLILEAENLTFRMQFNAKFNNDSDYRKTIEDIINEINVTEINEIIDINKEIFNYDDWSVIKIEQKDK
jgi:predicted Zn-dependent peptidase